jgi:hypothetical protein
MCKDLLVGERMANLENKAVHLVLREPQKSVILSNVCRGDRDQIMGAL